MGSTKDRINAFNIAMDYIANPPQGRDLLDAVDDAYWAMRRFELGAEPLAHVQAYLQHRHRLAILRLPKSK